MAKKRPKWDDPNRPDPIGDTLDDPRQPWWWRKIVGPAIDRFNKNLPPAYQTDDLSMTPSIDACRFRRLSHCLSGDTEIMTIDGPMPIKTLSGTVATILDGDGNWTDAPIRSFGEQQLFEVVIETSGDSRSIFATSGHRWFIIEARERREVLTVPAGTAGLQRGDCLAMVSREQNSPSATCTVVEVNMTDRVEEVFCATVPTTASFALFGYILTGNCWYPDQLDEAGTQEAGYDVWIPVDRGICTRAKDEEQRKCPVYQPGPESGEETVYPDATIPWSEGGQRRFRSYS